MTMVLSHSERTIIWRFSTIVCWGRCLGLRWTRWQGTAGDCTVSSCMTCGPHHVLLIWSNKPERGGWWRDMYGGEGGCVHQSWERGLELWSVIVSSGSPFVEKNACSFIGSCSCLFASRCVKISCSLRLVGFLTETRAVIQPPPHSPGVNHRRGVKANARGTKKQDTSFSFLGGTEERLRISWAGWGMRGEEGRTSLRNAWFQASAA